MEYNLYPNFDNLIFLRTANKEVETPVEGEITFGSIPKWVNGTLLRNGPGGPDAYGERQCEHIFDAPGLLHKFAISDGRVQYTNRFIRSKSYGQNTTARRLVLSEFGTFSTPDPCDTIFNRVTALFSCEMDKILTDNANISVQAFGDEIYALGETPFAHRIDLENLETTNTINVYQDIGVIHHTAHPHVEASNGKVYNLGEILCPRRGPCHIIVEICTNDPPSSLNPSKSPWSTAKVVCRVPARWPLNLCYMHTFSVTPNYFVIIEQPLAMSLLRLPYNFTWAKKPICSSLQYFPEEDTIFHVIPRNSGNGLRTKSLRSPGFCFMHTINAFELEENGCEYVVVDICTYKDSKMIDGLFVDACQNAQSNPDYAKMFRARPNRFRLNLSQCDKKNNFRVVAEEIVNIGCELPQINYAAYNGKPYRYFFAVSSDVDLDHPGTLIKVDTVTNTHRTWKEPNAYPSEPVFLLSPTAKGEDDGVILSAMLYGGEGSTGHTRSSLAILDAKKWELLCKIDFNTQSTIPKCLHGWFFPDQSAMSKRKNKLE